MNLFILDEDPRLAARQYCDIHTNKIILEAASCMCAAHWDYGFLDFWDAPLPLRRGQYRGRTHHNNHVTQWVRESTGNYQWTAEHAIALCDEYSRRYQIRHGSPRMHGSRPVVEWLADNIPPIINDARTPFRQAIEENCYHPNVVVAYWTYYAACKHHLAEWKYTETPSWYLSLTRKRLIGFQTHELLTHAEELFRAQKRANQKAAA